MTRWLVVVVLTLAMGHSPQPLPWAAPIVVSLKPLELFSLSEQRDSLVARAARLNGIPVWLALSIAHAETWGGDSAVVNPWSGAAGIGQIHPVNFGRFPECGDNMLNRRTSICYMMRLLELCSAEILADVLNCYGGAASIEGMRRYNLDVTRKMRLDWLE